MTRLPKKHTGGEGGSATSRILTRSLSAHASYQISPASRSRTTEAQSLNSGCRKMRMPSSCEANGQTRLACCTAPGAHTRWVPGSKFEVTAATLGTGSRSTTPDQRTRTLPDRYLNPSSSEPTPL